MQQDDSAIYEEIERIKLRAAPPQIPPLSTHTGGHPRTDQIGQLELAAESGDRLKELMLGKQLRLLEKELRTREQS